MKNSIHVFIQINTDKLQSYGAEPTNSQVRQCTIISSQGSMTIGSPIKDLEFDVAAFQNVHFSIVPLNIMSYHKLFFTEFKVNEESKKGIDMKNKHMEEHQLSFCVNIGKAKKNATASFFLNAVFEYSDESGTKHIPICIDPKMRVTQGGDHP